MDENKKEEKKLEKKADVKQEIKKEEPKFKQVDKKETNKAEKQIKKEKNKKDRAGKKSPVIPTVIVVVVVLLIAILLTVMIVTSSAPKKSLEALLTNLKSGDFTKAQEYVSGDLDLGTVNSNEEAQKLLFNKLNWKINKVTEKDENNATVEVEITTKDFQTIINNYMKKALDAVRETITGGGSTESFSSADFEKYFIEELKNENIQTTTITTTVNAVKEDNKWKIVSDDALYNAVLPGLQEAVNTLAD